MRPPNVGRQRAEAGLPVAMEIVADRIAPGVAAEEFVSLVGRHFVPGFLELLRDVPFVLLGDLLLASGSEMVPTAAHAVGHLLPSLVGQFAAGDGELAAEVGGVGSKLLPHFRRDLLRMLHVGGAGHVAENSSHRRSLAARSFPDAGPRARRRANLLGAFAQCRGPTRRRRGQDEFPAV